MSYCKKGANIMKIVLNAGHTKSGAGSGAVGYINESTETRKVVALVAEYLKVKGHTVVIDNVDKARSQSAYLSQVVKTANKTGADLFVSIHFNAGGGKGVECYTWKGQKVPSAVGVCAELNKLGFRNRGVKDGSGFYVIKKTTMPAVLVEVCFVDNELDARLYNALGVKLVAKAIANAL